MKKFFISHLALAALILSALGSNAQQPNPATHNGKLVYDQQCAACHGADGNGDGPASVWLYPKPRNFSAGQFKIKSTPA